MEFARIQDLPLLPKLFPNLRHLNLERLGGPVVDDSQVDETRQRHLSQYASAYPWYRLTHVSGDVKTLYMLALAHEIHRVDVHRMELTGTHIHERLAAVLLETRPTHLELEVVLSSAHTSGAHLARLLPDHSRITHLRLTFPSRQALVLDMGEVTVSPISRPVATTRADIRDHEG